MLEQVVHIWGIGEGGGEVGERGLQLEWCYERGETW